MPETTSPPDYAALLEQGDVEHKEILTALKAQWAREDAERKKARDEQLEAFAQGQRDRDAVRDNLGIARPSVTQPAHVQGRNPGPVDPSNYPGSSGSQIAFTQSLPGASDETNQPERPKFSAPTTPALPRDTVVDASGNVRLTNPTPAKPNDVNSVANIETKKVGSERTDKKVPEAPVAPEALKTQSPNTKKDK